MTNKNNVLSVMNSRRSIPIQSIGYPAPNKEEIISILAAATRVPDHCALTPWRIKIVSGGDRAAFADALVAAYETDTPDPVEKRFAKLKAMAEAPLTCIVYTQVDPSSKVPEVEQILSCGALCQNITLAAVSLGYATNWLTGPTAYCPTLKKTLGIDEKDVIAGYILIGTPTCVRRDRPRPLLHDIVSTWPEGATIENSKTIE